MEDYSRLITEVRRLVKDEEYTQDTNLSIAFFLETWTVPLHQTLGSMLASIMI